MNFFINIDADSLYEKRVKHASCRGMIELQKEVIKPWWLGSTTRFAQGCEWAHRVLVGRASTSMCVTWPYSSGRCSTVKVKHVASYALLFDSASHSGFSFYLSAPSVARNEVVQRRRWYSDHLA